MATLILGEHPAPLVLKLTAGSPVAFSAVLRDLAGAPLPWASPVRLVVKGSTVGPLEATVAGDTATWSLSAATVDALAGLERAHIEAAGRVVAAGPVDWSSGWEGSQPRPPAVIMIGAPA